MSRIQVTRTPFDGGSLNAIKRGHRPLVSLPIQLVGKRNVPATIQEQSDLKNRFTVLEILTAVLV